MVASMAFLRVVEHRPLQRCLRYRSTSVGKRMISLWWFTPLADCSSGDALRNHDHRGT